MNIFQLISSKKSGLLITLFQTVDICTTWFYPEGLWCWIMAWDRDWRSLFPWDWVTGMQVMKQLEHTVDEGTGNIWKRIIHTWHTQDIKHIRFVCEPFTFKMFIGTQCYTRHHINIRNPMKCIESVFSRNYAKLHRIVKTHSSVYPFLCGCCVSWPGGNWWPVHFVIVRIHMRSAYLRYVTVDHDSTILWHWCLGTSSMMWLDWVKLEKSNHTQTISRRHLPLLGEFGWTWQTSMEATAPHTLQVLL